MAFGSLDGGGDSEISGFGFVEMPKIFVMQGIFYFRTEPIDRLHHRSSLAISALIIPATSGRYQHSRNMLLDTHFHNIHMNRVGCTVHTPSVGCQGCSEPTQGVGTMHHENFLASVPSQWFISWPPLFEPLCQQILHNYSLFTLLRL